MGLVGIGLPREVKRGSGDPAITAPSPAGARSDLAQAENWTPAAAIPAHTSAALPRAVARFARAQLLTTPRRGLAACALRDWGLIVV